MYKPNRMCVSCRKRCEKQDLIRITSNGAKPVVDNKKSQSSRGVYVCKNPKCIDMLKKNKAIERFLKVKPDNNFYDNLNNY